ncbi:hypothetical protein [Salinibaculum salinum]|uniref:hypothetical protein n=1 Tax=Salinibaculum salinum TaxID=3131996 RepID=UPI0030EE3DB4
MVSIPRRSFLKAVGIMGTSMSTAGCSRLGSTDSSESLPAGSLKFHNDDTVPHEVSVEVLNVGTSMGERIDGHDTVTGTPDVAVPQRDLTATAILEPGQTGTYESVFESRVLYDIRFTLDDMYPGEDLGRTVFHPNPSSNETTGQILGGNVSDGGELSWQISPTDNLGPSFQ